MNVKILGAHNTESQDTRFISLLIDDIIAIDAGGLTASLSFAAQRQIRAILLTHQHYDHIRDVPAIAMNLYLNKASVNIYSIQAVYDALTTHLLNGVLYPDFLNRPTETPTIKFKQVQPHISETFAGYNILAVPVNHSVPTVGYQITSPEGKTMFYTGDSGPGLADCWHHISPQLLIIEVTVPNSYEDFARDSGHLTPGLLHQELKQFQKLKGYLPQVITVHMNPAYEAEIASEIANVNTALNNAVSTGHEGMQFNL